jgi:hypothetical protein
VNPIVERDISAAPNLALLHAEIFVMVNALVDLSYGPPRIRDDLLWIAF